MTNAQNRKRWAVNQRKLARAKFAESLAERDEIEKRARIVNEFMNMFFGVEYTKIFKGKSA